MLQVLGIKRVLILVALVSLNAAMASANYLYMIPQNTILERDLRAVKSEISGKRMESERLRTEFMQIQEQKTYFEAIRDSGFMSVQNRLVARRRIMDIQQYTNVLRATYSIDSAQVINNEDIKNVKHVLLRSPITVEIDALDDLDFYNFIYWMENAFSGHISATNIKIRRLLDINEASLRAIGSGAPTALISGRVDFIWQTMVPESDIQFSEEFGSGG